MHPTVKLVLPVADIFKDAARLSDLAFKSICWEWHNNFIGLL